jgi:nuclear control of ATPase protein 2
MSVVTDRVNALRTQLHNLATTQIQSIPSEPPTSVYLVELNTSLSILSSSGSTSPSLDQIARLIIEVNQAKLKEPEHITRSDYAKDLEWLFLARCAVDVYGCLLEQLFKQTLPLAQDIFYWDDILSQPGWRLLFLIQSQPHHPSSS